MTARALSRILPPAPSSGLPPYLRAERRLPWILAVVLTWNARYRMRCRLGALPDHMLSDIGLSRDDVLVETGKPVWRP